MATTLEKCDALDRLNSWLIAQQRLGVRHVQVAEVLSWLPPDMAPRPSQEPAAPLARKDPAALTLATAKLEGLPLPVLRAIWTRTKRIQDEEPIPSRKRDIVAGLVGYFDLWHDSEPTVVDEAIDEAREFGQESTSLADTRRHHRDEPTTYVNKLKRGL